MLLRCPIVGGKVGTVDDAAAKASPGVSFVGKIGDSAVAVVADSTWNALKGRRALKVTWDGGGNQDLNSAAIFEGLRNADESKAVKFFTAGDVSKATGRKTGSQLSTSVHGPRAHGARQLRRRFSRDGM